MEDINERIPERQKYTFGENIRMGARSDSTATNHHHEQFRIRSVTVSLELMILIFHPCFGLPWPLHPIAEYWKASFGSLVLFILSK